MNANEAAEIIIAAIGEDRPLDASDLATALSHLGLLPQPVAQQQNQSHELASHHRVDQDTVSAPHARSSSEARADASWQRLIPQPPGTA